MGRKRRGHYCYVCGDYRANEKFTGRGHARHICKDCSRRKGSQGTSADHVNGGERSDLGIMAVEEESSESRLVRDLTLMLMYLTSRHDDSIDARRCLKNFHSDIINEMIGNELVRTRPGNKSIAFTEQGEEEALLLLDRYGFEASNGSPLTLREIRWAVSQLLEADREELIRELINSELAKSEMG